MEMTIVMRWVSHLMKADRKDLGRGASFNCLKIFVVTIQFFCRVWLLGLAKLRPLRGSKAETDLQKSDEEKDASSALAISNCWLLS